MVKPKPNAGKSWSSNDLTKLKKLADGNTPTGLIAYQLGRSKNAIQAIASAVGMSLKPTNKSPYTRRKK